MQPNKQQPGSQSSQVNTSRSQDDFSSSQGRQQSQDSTKDSSQKWAQTEERDQKSGMGQQSGASRQAPSSTNK